MDEKAILEAMSNGFANVGSKLDAQLAELNEKAEKLLVKPEDIKTPAELAAEAAVAKVAEEAKLERAAVSTITDMKVWDIPVGEALVGGFSAVFASELIDGVLVKQNDMIKGVIKLAGAGAAVKWGPRLLGSTGSKALAILLAYDGVRSLIPIDAWARRGASAVSGVLPAGGLGGFRKNAGAVVPDNGKQPAGRCWESCQPGSGCRKTGE